MDSSGRAADIWDVVVVGAGPPGENAAHYARRGGLTAVLVEAELVGGECSYWACMPSKALLRPIEVLGAARAMPGLSTAPELDVASVLERRDGFTSHHDDAGQVSWAEGVGVDVVRGRGRLAGARRVEVTASDGATRVLAARHAVVVATGSAAAVPPVPGLREALPWTSRDVTNLHEVPRRVAVIGGGVVACEAATWLAGLGAEVTVVERGSSLLGNQEPFAGELVAAELRNRGVTVLTDASVQKVLRATVEATGAGRTHGGEVTVVLDDGQEILADEVVVATGRRPRTDDLGLETIGVDAGSYLSTDDTLLVEGVEGQWLYAVGDVNGRALLTHMGKYQARVAGEVIAARAAGRALDAAWFAATADHRQVPQVTFTQPQVGSVGLTLSAAQDAGLPVRAVDHDIDVAGASLLRDDWSGRARLVVDTADEVLVGATFVGPDVAELVHAATVTVVGRVPLERLWHAVPAYPTVSEVWLRLLETWRFGEG